jgi:hypothetical protein
MAKITKIVRFYEPISINGAGVESELEPGFWDEFIELASKLVDYEERLVHYAGAQYHGSAEVSQIPPMRYLIVGRVRPRSDWPSQLDAGGSVTPLRINGSLFERAFLVPFGHGNMIGFMPPIGSRIGLTAVERWLTHVAGLDTTEHRLELRPKLDTSVQQKLQTALGVSRVTIRVPTNAEIDIDEAAENGGDLGIAVASATQAKTHEMTAELTYSLGHKKDEIEGRENLLRLARWASRRGDMERIDANLLFADGDKLRVESINLVKEYAATHANLDVSEDTEYSDDSVILTGIRDAIRTYFEPK